MLRKSMKFLLIFLIPILLCNIVFAEELPSDERINEIYQSNPEIIYEMIRKLYVLERASIDLTLPDAFVYFQKNGGIVVEYKGEGTAFIGNEKYNLHYGFEVKPKEATAGYTPPNRLKWGWIVAGGVSAFALGLLAGSLAR